MSGLEQEYDNFVVDIDGVCYLDGQLFEGVPEALATLEARGLQLFFVTNNSYRTPERFAAALTKAPYEADPARIVTSSQAAARYVAGEVVGFRQDDLEGCGPGRVAAGTLSRREVVFAGGEGLYRALEEAGLHALEPEEWGGEGVPAAVVVGIDRRFYYGRLAALSDLVRRGARFVATNTDATYPTPRGLEPGAGSLVAAVEVAAGKKAVVAGKPHAPMVELVRRRMPEGRTLVIGDRPETDVEFARALGADAALVFTGVAGTGDLVSSPTLPRWVARSLPALLDAPVEVVESEGRVSFRGADTELVCELQKVSAKTE